VLCASQTSTASGKQQLHFFLIPQNTHKTQQNREIHVDRPLLTVEICSAHQNSLERIQIEELVLPISSALPGNLAVLRLNSVEGENNMADSREVMNIRQASQYLGVSPDTLYKYVNEQKIPAFKLGNRWRFKKSKLDQWMEEKSMEVEPRGKKKPRAAVKAAGSQ
jgi:excisionase family DNA binding protein